MGIFDKFLGGDKSNKSVLGIDISSSSIKVVQAKKSKGRGVLETYGELALGPYTGLEMGRATNLGIDKLSEALIDLLKEAKTTTKEAGVAIPISSSLVNIIKMPNVGEARMKEMIPIEMRKYIPVPVSEVVMDWKIIPKSLIKEDQDDDHVEVFVVSIHQETINRYQEIVKRAGLKVSFFEIEVFSTIRSVIEDSRNPSMIIDFGAGTTKAYIIDDGIVRDSHIINRGSQDINQSLSRSMGLTLKKAEEIKREQGLSIDPKNANNYKISSLVVENILREAGQVLINFEKKFNKIVEKTYLSGGGSLLKGFPEIAKKIIDSEVIIGNPFGKLQYPAFLDNTLKEAGPEFAVSVGVLLRKLEEE